MSAKAADDFESIRRAMDALKCEQADESEPVCKTCEGGGWVMVYSPCPPSFETCPDCYNPEDLPCP